MDEPPSTEQSSAPLHEPLPEPSAPLMTIQNPPQEKTLWNSKNEQKVKRKSFIPWGILTILFSIGFVIIGGANLGFHIWRFINDPNRSDYNYAFWIMFFVLDGITLCIGVIGFCSGILYKFPKPRVAFAYIVSYILMIHV